MTALAVVLGQPAAETAVHALLDRAEPRGSEARAVVTTEQGAVGASWAVWEAVGSEQSFAVFDDGSVVVAADASLYYLADLRAALAAAAVSVRGDTPAHLIAAAYRAWGSACVARLEGDFAFVLWDRLQKRALLARDFQGTRPLFFTSAGGALVAGSSLDGVAQHPGVSRALNLASLAEDIASVAGTVLHETAYSAVSRLPAGHLLRWSLGNEPVVERFWEPPFFEQADALEFDAAAEALRELLMQAVIERLSPQGSTAVWMSGGYDSTAVFTSGRAGNAAAQLIPVSVSYPPGDAGREDELIAQVAQRHGADVHWVQSGSIAGLGDALRWGARRDEPSAHAFEPWNRALVSATRAAGAHVALNGNGGDQFFAVSPVILADLLAAGQWRDLGRERRALGFKGLRTLLYWTVVPWLQGPSRRAVARLRGRAPRHYLEDQLPRWLPEKTVRRTGLLERRRPPEFRRRGETHGSAESAWYLLGAFGPRIIATASGLALQGGVETRSPLYDRRIIEFAARRPWNERLHLGEKKRLLRASMRDLLPPEVLAPRPRRTGLPGGWLRRQLLEFLPGLVSEMAKECRLADLGLVEPALLKEDWELFARAPEQEVRRGAGVFHAVAAEYWLRARLPRDGSQLPALVA